jgi:hypothetical protein
MHAIIIQSWAKINCRIFWQKSENGFQIPRNRRILHSSTHSFGLAGLPDGLFINQTPSFGTSGSPLNGKC